MVVGLTGGIGSGKSVIARMFSVLGCLVFNSDEVAKEIYFHEQVKPRIVSLLGEEAYLPGSAIDRKYISSRVFNDPELLLRLNAIIHPAVMESFLLFREKHKNTVVIKETALLFETGQEPMMDKVVLVAASKELRIRRVMERDGATREDVLRKIQSQLPQEEKIERSDFVIYNDEKKFVIDQVLTIYNQLKHA